MNLGSSKVSPLCNMNNKAEDLIFNGKDIFQ